MRRLAIHSFGLALLLAAATAIVARADGDAAPAAPKAPAPERPAGKAIPGGRAFADLAYGKVGDVTLLLDLYVPEPAPKNPTPLVVWIHGGGWIGGSKTPCPTVGMLALGFSTASVEYRFSNVAPFPAQIEDCKASIRWLRANAGLYHLDPSRIGVAGASAGGHLVALLGTSGGEKSLEGDAGNAEQSSRVDAVCDICGPTDLAQFDGHGSTIVAASKGSLIETLLGGPLATHLDLAKRANPISYLDKRDPPMLVFHGDKDNVVPIQQSELLDAACRRAGVPCTFVVVSGAGHGCAGPPQIKQMSEFFTKQLGRPRNARPGYAAPGDPPPPPGPSDPPPQSPTTPTPTK